MNALKKNEWTIQYLDSLINSNKKNTIYHASSCTSSNNLALVLKLTRSQAKLYRPI
jgi:hypothetical protein